MSDISEYELELGKCRAEADDMIDRCDSRFQAIDTELKNVPLPHVLLIYTVSMVARAVTCGAQAIILELRHQGDRVCRSNAGRPTGRRPRSEQRRS